LRGWEGDVLFEVLVTKTGRVGQLQMLTSSGYRSLDNAAQKALKRWIFKPATTFGGIEIDSLVRVPIKFSLQTL
jgi:protein TonB